jgi:thiol:disulfide interchange protein
VESIPLHIALPAAFLGGLILNVMPCVLPVLTMKVFHLLEQGGQDDPRMQRLHGLAYTAGIVSTFVVFATILIALRASGELVGWGMHFQDPRFVAAMIAIMVLFGLNALGVYEFALSVSGDGATRGGWVGSFVNGVLASIMATPCSAPFLGTAAVAALGASVPAWTTLLLFVVMGVGLASPFTLFSFAPRLARLLPRPGAWMETFKHLMGFSLLAAAVWLSGTLLRQVTPASFHRFLILLLVIGVSAWAWGRWGGLDHPRLRRLLVRGAVLVAVTSYGTQYLQLEKASIVRAVFAEDAVVDGKINWQPFSPEAVGAFHARNRPVFVDYTADWCQNCKANEALFIETERIRTLLVETGVVPMKADMTNDDPVILRWLTDLGRNGIPAYAIYLPDGTTDLLPVAITTELLAEHLLAAAHRFPPHTHTASVSP